MAPLTVIDGSQVGTYVNATARVLAQLTVTRTGYWAAAAYYHVNSGSEGGSHQLLADLRFNGTSQAQVSMWRQAGANDGAVGVYSPAVLISAGQVIQLFGSKGHNEQANLDQLGLRAYFMPMFDYRI